MVTSEHVVRADVRIRNGRVVEVGHGLRVGREEVIDADGLHVLPGIIDSHVHQWEAGVASRADFRDDTASATLGGVTTIVDHPFSPPETISVDRLQSKIAIGDATSFVDFAELGGASPGNIEQLPAMRDAGVVGFKLVMCGGGTDIAPFTNERDLADGLRMIASLDSIALVHAEDQATLDANERRLRGQAIHGPAAFLEWRSASAETIAIRRLLGVAKKTETRTYVVHVSTAEGVNSIADARRAGQLVYAETCPHYLFLTADDVVSSDSRYTTMPPARDRDNVDELRSLLVDHITVVASDHSAVIAAQKAVDDPLAVKAGMPGIEFLLPAMLELASAGVLSLPILVRLLCQRPARLFGLSDRKGSLLPGADGDVVLVALDDVAVPRVSNSARWSPYEHMSMRGKVVRTILRGVTIAVDGKTVADAGVGQFVHREHPPLAV